MPCIELQLIGGTIYPPRKACKACIGHLLMAEAQRRPEVWSYLMVLPYPESNIMFVRNFMSEL